MRKDRVEGRTLLKFTRQVGKYLRGDITARDPNEAQLLFDQGAAVPYTAPKEESEEKSGDGGSAGRRRVRS